MTVYGGLEYGGLEYGGLEYGGLKYGGLEYDSRSDRSECGTTLRYGAAL